jgi:Xaa-Pro aminopeptidase
VATLEKPLRSDTDGRTVFSEAEISRRRRVLHDALKPLELDFGLIHTADNSYYVSGVPLLSEWGRPMWFVLRPDGEGAVVGAAIERENMEMCSFFDTVLVYDDSKMAMAGALGRVVDFIGGDARRIGAELEQLTVAARAALLSAFPSAELVDMTPALQEARLLKSDEELAILRMGGEIAKIGAGAFLDAVKEGVSELAVAAEALDAMDRALAAMNQNALSSTYVYCQTALRTLTPHLHPGGRRIRRGDLVALNVFPVISGYCMELERTFVFGAGNEELEGPLKAVTEAFEAAKRAAVSGTGMRDVDSVATACLRSAGFDEFIRHGTGHAHGIMIGAGGREELGELRPYNPRPLQPRMVCSIEPGVYISDVGGFRHSDVMVIHDERTECLTEFPVEIEIG